MICRSAATFFSLGGSRLQKRRGESGARSSAKWLPISAATLCEALLLTM
jgi:hypothetical protein